MKNLNKKGFTLIELLAVITIMGILMMVAIPAVSRTIENSRRDTFADVAQNYLNAVRNSILTDELACGDYNVSATPNGAYYFGLSTEKNSTYEQQTKDIMESGGKSPWGNADVTGYILWTKQDGRIIDGAQSTDTTYYVYMTDKGGHGLNTLVKDQAVSRGKVSTSGQLDWLEKAADNSPKNASVQPLTLLNSVAPKTPASEGVAKVDWPSIQACTLK